MNLDAMAEIVLAGVNLGALYALFGLGLSLSLGVMRMINIAHGDLIVLSAYLASVFMAALGVGPAASLLAVVPTMFVLGWLLQQGLLNRMLQKEPLAPLLLTFGLSVVLQHVLQEAFTADTRSLPADELGTMSVMVGGLSVGVLPLVITGVSAAAYALTALLIRRTHWGRQIRAVASDPETARLVGIDDRKLFAAMTAFTLALIAVAGVLYGIRTPFAPSSGPERLLYAFEAVVLGGLGNLWGTFAGGLVIGLAHVLGAHVESGLGPFFGHLVFLAGLIARPAGLFSKVLK